MKTLKEMIENFFKKDKSGGTGQILHGAVEAVKIEWEIGPIQWQKKVVIDYKYLESIKTEGIQTREIDLMIHFPASRIHSVEKFLRKKGRISSKKNIDDISKYRITTNDLLSIVLGEKLAKKISDNVVISTMGGGDVLYIRVNLEELDQKQLLLERGKYMTIK